MPAVAQQPSRFLFGEFCVAMAAAKAAAMAEAPQQKARDPSAYLSHIAGLVLRAASRSASGHSNSVIDSNVHTSVLHLAKSAHLQSGAYIAASEMHALRILIADAGGITY